MKKVLLLTGLLLLINSIFAQPRPKPAAPAAPAKPAAPPPYVLKKDFDSHSEEVKKLIRGIQGSMSSLQSNTNAKLNQIDDLTQQMKQVEDILNSTQFKMTLTSDSLNKTRTSVEEVQKEFKMAMAELTDKNNTLNNQLLILWGISFGLVLLCVLWFINNRKQGQRMKLLLDMSNIDMRKSIEEQSATLLEKIRKESNSAQQYTDYQHKISKERMDTLSESIAHLRKDIMDLSKPDDSEDQI
jgi:predicted  nucleic acid-binding Zn-ribbon protein